MFMLNNLPQLTCVLFAISIGQADDSTERLSNANAPQPSRANFDEGAATRDVALRDRLSAGTEPRSRSKPPILLAQVAPFAAGSTSEPSESQQTDSSADVASGSWLERLNVGELISDNWPVVANSCFKLLLVLIGTIALRRVISRGSLRLQTVLAKGTFRGSSLDRENRAQTLVGVFQNVAVIALYIGAGIVVLEALNIPIAPLLGGVAVFGLAVAFGAQNLIKDYFYGFMILLENQYGVNDVVRIGGVAGLVERITLRLTLLRDSEGTAHFIPHGQITTVSNMTHTWSRAVFEIGVGYGEDTDQVVDVLMQLAAEIRQDPELGPVITDDAQMLGVDALGDSAVVVKFFIKTMPLKQWSVKREMLRRIKKKFDELGIEIPFPHRTLYIRHENASSEAATTGS